MNILSHPSALAPVTGYSVGEVWLIYGRHAPRISTKIIRGKSLPFICLSSPFSVSYSRHSVTPNIGTCSAREPITNKENATLSTGLTQGYGRLKKVETQVPNSHQSPTSQLHTITTCRTVRMTAIYLYAEVLANIQQANLYASLSTNKNEDTKIDISSDRKTVTVRHDGETASIYLPTAISGDAQVTVPINRGKEIALRLQLAELTTLPLRETNVGDDGPWSAKSLTPNARIRCRVCHTELLTNEVPLVYKDLPSDHWAEMMDLWHCHRPHDLDHGDERGSDDANDAFKAAATKGYGASSRLKASVGVALVSPFSILLAEQSCRNVQVSRIVFRLSLIAS